MGATTRILIMVIQLELIHYFNRRNMSIDDEGRTHLDLFLGIEGKEFQVPNNIHFGHRRIIGGNHIKELFHGISFAFFEGASRNGVVSSGLAHNIKVTNNILVDLLPSNKLRTHKTETNNAHIEPESLGKEIFSLGAQNVSRCILIDVGIFIHVLIVQSELLKKPGKLKKIIPIVFLELKHFFFGFSLFKHPFGPNRSS